MDLSASPSSPRGRPKNLDSSVFDTLVDMNLDQGAHLHFKCLVSRRKSPDLKGQFTPKLEAHVFLLTCCAVYLDGFGVSCIYTTMHRANRKQAQGHVSQIAVKTPIEKHNPHVLHTCLNNVIKTLIISAYPTSLNQKIPSFFIFLFFIFLEYGRAGISIHTAVTSFDFQLDPIGDISVTIPIFAAMQKRFSES